ncbi:hypothetical protein HAZT_HAZT002147 [Hyalella azteca]|uniref:Chitin-binding type-2 domain-containing protein n=1 Tax=Hyalella azteca TaxID=294128 RepID=A0A6A0H2V4_HYAAZ|nr:hypothetical protein HAZT_HAZT002147 [Hyalella azteca]
MQQRQWWWLLLGAMTAGALGASVPHMHGPSAGEAAKFDPALYKIAPFLYDLRYHPYASLPASERTGALDPHCPQANGLFPHPRDCGLFISCAHGRGCVMECPATLQFNSTLSICMYQWMVQCTLDASVDVKDWPLPRSCADIVASGQTPAPVPGPAAVSHRPPNPLFPAPCTCPQGGDLGRPHGPGGPGGSVGPEGPGGSVGPGGPGGSIGPGGPGGSIGPGGPGGSIGPGGPGGSIGPGEIGR